jgi:hypothetical protein
MAWRVKIIAGCTGNGAGAGRPAAPSPSRSTGLRVEAGACRGGRRPIHAAARPTPACAGPSFPHARPPPPARTLRVTPAPTTGQHRQASVGPAAALRPHTRRHARPHARAWRARGRRRALRSQRIRVTADSDPPRPCHQAAPPGGPAAPTARPVGPARMAGPARTAGQPPHASPRFAARAAWPGRLGSRAGPGRVGWGRAGPGAPGRDRTRRRPRRSICVVVVVAAAAAAAAAAG